MSDSKILFNYTTGSLLRESISRREFASPTMRSVMLALSCLCGGSLAFSAGAKSPAAQRLQNAASATSSTATRQAVSPSVQLRQVLRRSDQQSLNMLSADKPLKIGVVGVTGAVGVEIIDVLGVHGCWKAGP